MIRSKWSNTSRPRTLKSVAVGSVKPAHSPRARASPPGNVGRCVAKAHLVCARLVRDYWTSHTVPTNQLTALAASSGLPLGLLRDLACELATPPEQLAARQAQQASYDILYDDMRLADPDRSAGLHVLLVERGQNAQQDRGVVATLSLEVIPDGAGALYPAPALAPGAA